MLKKLNGIIYEYFKSENGTGTICSLTIYLMTEEIKIPDEIDGVPIKEIACTLRPTDKTRRVVIGNGIEKLPQSFLTNSKHIEEVVWPTSAKTIPDYCFLGCLSLKKVENINNVEIIGEKSFCEAGINFLDLSQTSINTINKMAFFQSCVAHIIWPSSCEVIPERCFANGMLNTIENINNVTKICKAAFENTELKSIDLKDTKIIEIESHAFALDYQLEYVIWPTDCTTVPDYCFSTSKVKNITNIHNVESIGRAAFMSTELKCINLHDLSNLEYVGDYAFAECTQLTEVKWNPECDTIRERCFNCCVNLNKISDAENVRIIGPGAFSNCGFSQLNICKMFKNVEFIGDYAFSCCVNLSSVVWTQKVQEVRDGLFCRCYKLSNIKNFESAVVIGKKSFAKTALTEVDLSNSDKLILVYSNSFDSCSMLNILLYPYYTCVVNANE